MESVLNWSSMSNKSFNIGIVEDEPWSAQMVKECVEELGHSVAFVALSANEAIEFLKECEVQVLFLDINILGPIDGIQLARNLSKEIYKPVIIYMTAHTDSKTVDEAVGTDPVFFMAKPFGQKEIEIALAMAISAIKKLEPIAPSLKNPLLVICTQTRMPMYKGTYLSLTPKERIVAARLIDSAGAVVRHSELENLLWEDPELINHGSLRNIIASLRKKLPDCTIENVLDMGYILHFYDTNITLS